MNHNHMFVINRAIDGEDIHGVKSFSNKEMSKIQLDQSKEDLIRIGVLEGFNSFTTNGRKFAKLVYEYKNASRYIHFNNMIIAPITNDLAIVMKIKDGIYGFRPVKIKDIYGQFSEVYSFLKLYTSESDEAKQKPIKATLKDLFITYKIKKHNSFVIRTYTPEDSKETSELFFEYDQKCYVFETKVRLLSQVSPNEQKNRLLERMSVNV